LETENQGGNQPIHVYLVNCH